MRADNPPLQIPSQFAERVRVVRFQLILYTYLGEYFKINRSTTDGEKPERASERARDRGVAQHCTWLGAAQVAILRNLPQVALGTPRSVHIAEVRPVPKLNYVQSRFDILPP